MSVHNYVSVRYLKIEVTSHILHNALLTGKLAALSGLGGIGKTQTAIEYAYRYRNEYDLILWVRAESRSELVLGFVTAWRTPEV